MDFEELMQEAQSLHLGHDYDMALSLRLEAYVGTGDATLKGRAARDVAASLDRIGLLGPAIEWADDAYSLHNGVVEAQQVEIQRVAEALAADAPTKMTEVPQSLRERAASAMYVGSLALRQAIHLEQAHKPHKVEAEKSLEFLTRGLEDISKVEVAQGGGIDQYRINMTGRVAQAEALYGKKWRALQLGARSIGLAVLSESAVVVPFKHDMPMKDRLKTRAKVAVRGAVALVATALSFQPFRSLALNLTDKML